MFLEQILDKVPGYFKLTRHDVSHTRAKELEKSRNIVEVLFNVSSKSVSGMIDRSTSKIDFPLAFDALED